MKLFINLLISTALLLLPVLSVASPCCCANGLEKQTSQLHSEKKASSSACHHAMQDTKKKHHDLSKCQTKCQCDQHATSSLLSVNAGDLYFQQDTSVIIAYSTPIIFPHSLDNIYRPPIAA